MSSIVLKSGQVTAVIEQEGAFLTSLHDGSRTVIFPRKQIQSSYGVWKTRGGCHICFPNFGPGGESGEARHGFGRVENWDQLTTSDSQVYLRLTGSREPYDRLRADLRYTLQEDSMRCELLVKNMSDEAVAIAPAFHPYFAFPEGLPSAKVDDEVLYFDELEGTRFIPTPDTIKLGDMTLYFRHVNLGKMAVWTDLLDDYVCFEPTHSGNSFEEAPEETLSLGPDEHASFMMEFQWAFDDEGEEHPSEEA